MHRWLTAVDCRVTSGVHARDGRLKAVDCRVTSGVHAREGRLKAVDCRVTSGVITRMKMLVRCGNLIVAVQRALSIFCALL